jgi:hypothetical protein
MTVSERFKMCATPTSYDDFDIGLTIQPEVSPQTEQVDT